MIWKRQRNQRQRSPTPISYQPIREYYRWPNLTRLLILTSEEQIIIKSFLLFPPGKQLLLLCTFPSFFLFLTLLLSTINNFPCLFDSQIFDFPGFSLISPESISKVRTFFVCCMTKMVLSQYILVLYFFFSLQRSEWRIQNQKGFYNCQYLVYNNSYQLPSLAFDFLMFLGFIKELVIWDLQVSA